MISILEIVGHSLTLEPFMTSLLSVLINSLIRLFLRRLNIFGCQILTRVLLLMLVCKPRVNKWLLNINRPCFPMIWFTWRSLSLIVVVHFNLNLVIWTLNSHCCILRCLKILFLTWLFKSGWSVILLFFLLLSLFFQFLLFLHLFFLSSFFIQLLNS